MDRTIKVEERHQSITELVLRAAVAFALACQPALMLLFIVFVNDTDWPAVRTGAVVVFVATGVSFLASMTLQTLYDRRFGTIAQIAPCRWRCFGRFCTGQAISDGLSDLSTLFMSDTAVPDFFNRFPMRAVTSAELDAVLAEDAEPLSILFLWGRDCPNCDIAKRALLAQSDRFDWPRVRWLHDNVYNDQAMAHRFGLHGIPVFFVFRGARKIGRITSWPGADAFVEAIDKQVADLPD